MTIQDFDPGTLMELLKSLSQGRNVDTSSFGTWGVRNMDPKMLGTLTDAASTEWGKTQASREAADAHRRQSQDQLAGVWDTNDTSYQNALIKLLGEQQAIGSRQYAEDLRSKTELEKQRLHNQGWLDVEQEKSGTKTGKVPDMLQMQMVKVFQNPKWKPEEVQPFVDMLRMNKLNDAAEYYQNVVDTRKKEITDKAAAPGGGWTSKVGTFLNPSGWPSPAKNPIPQNYYQGLP